MWINLFGSKMNWLNSGNHLKLFFMKHGCNYFKKKIEWVPPDFVTGTVV